MEVMDISNSARHRHRFLEQLVDEHRVGDFADDDPSERFTQRALGWQIAQYVNDAFRKRRLAKVARISTVNIVLV